MTNSPLASPTATIAVLQKHGLYAKKRLGQHFLVDDNVVGRILALASLQGTETVLEIGPGIGTLTVALCQVADAVVAIERDPDLLPVLEETTADCPRFAVVKADAARVPVGEVCRAFGPPGTLVANLPYEVAATVVLRCFEEFPTLSAATVMVQAEVAERMAAEPGTKDYGAYTVKLRLRARPVDKFAVARTSFLPPPRVDSTVIRLERVAPGDASFVVGEDVVRDASRVADAAFAQRRKTIRNSLRGALGDVRAIDEALDSAGVERTVRAEALGPDAFIKLAVALRHEGVLEHRGS